MLLIYFFTNVATEIVSELGPPPENFTDYLGTQSKFKFHFTAVTSVEKAINSLNFKKTRDCEIVMVSLQN